MDKAELERMAEEAGLMLQTFDCNPPGYSWSGSRESLARFAALVHAKATAIERERAAQVCDDEARIRNEAAATHGPDTPARDRCYAAARAATNCAKGVRNGEVVEAIRAAAQKEPT